MIIVRVTKGGWGHKFYVFPVSLLEKIALYRRGYRQLRGFGSLYHSWVNNKYAFDYDEGHHWVNEGMTVRYVEKEKQLYAFGESTAEYDSLNPDQPNPFERVPKDSE